MDELLVSYQTESAAMIALSSLDIDAALISPSGLRPYVDAGKLSGLAVTGHRRLPGLNSVPTFADLGHAELSDLTGWSGFFARAGTPQPLVDRLYVELESNPQPPCNEAT